MNTNPNKWAQKEKEEKEKTKEERQKENKPGADSLGAPWDHDSQQAKKCCFDK